MTDGRGAEMRGDNQIRKQRRAQLQLVCCTLVMYTVLLFQNVRRERKCAEVDRHEQRWSVVDIQAKRTYMGARTYIQTDVRMYEW